MRSLGRRPTRQATIFFWDANIAALLLQNIPGFAHTARLAVNSHVLRWDEQLDAGDGRFGAGIIDHVDGALNAALGCRDAFVVLPVKAGLADAAFHRAHYASCRSRDLRTRIWAASATAGDLTLRAPNCKQ